MAQSNTHPSVLLEEVVKLVHQRIGATEAQQVEHFARLLYATLAKDELAKRHDTELFGALLSLWNTLKQTGKTRNSIRVFNPEQSVHGWHSVNTVIELVLPDMPFLVDSITMALTRHGVDAHLIVHSPLAVTRPRADQIQAIRSTIQADSNDEHLAVFFIEVDRLEQNERLTQLQSELQLVIKDVTAAVSQWQAMQKQLAEVIDEIEHREVGQQDEQEETLAFLRYISNHHFTFLGYRHYRLLPRGGEIELTGDNKTSLGIMRHRLSRSRLLSQLPEFARKEALGSNQLVLTKTNSVSRVHRPAYLDYIGIKQYGKQGQVIGEHRFIGLYASSIYNQSARQIPLIRQKLEMVLSHAELAPKSHDYKTLVNILETYPRDELIQASVEQLFAGAMGILHMQDRDKVRAFLRRDLFGRFVSVLVFTRKERYNTELRVRTQKLLAQTFGSEHDVEFTTYFSESRLARTHYLVKVADNSLTIDLQALQSNLTELTRTWSDTLHNCLIEAKGEAEGNRLFQHYQFAFTRSYMEEVLPNAALGDIAELERLSNVDELGILFYQPQEASHQVSLKLFHKDEPIPLSDILPILENFDFKVIGERPYRVICTDQQQYWILDFSMVFKRRVQEPFGRYQSRFQNALIEVWQGKAESDLFNALVLQAQLIGREASLLRAYGKYLRQLGVNFSSEYIAQALYRYPAITYQLVELFKLRFDPEHSDPQKFARLLAEIENRLTEVASLDDDRIIRLFLELICATLRTNYYQADQPELAAPYIAFKFDPSAISEMPLPLPQYEIFVYSPRVEGVHLRGAKIARGGLRWSERQEDFRTEILGLVKAQQVKNAVIVPYGAKGGFVCKKLPVMGREAMLAEGQSCYRLFIQGLLDLTDNIDQSNIIPPSRTICYDDNDPYLVVAADKGTATFSDLANEIAQQRGFWLGDAFASGGKHGYDHKKMGITARGAWESVKQHFLELGKDCQRENFTCIAIGDMAGDVFGNAMLQSRHTLLLAAFNHSYIFLDPNPDPEQSYRERQRLFRLPRSDWTDYDRNLISPGGGVFSRNAKSITLHSELQERLNINHPQLTPNELIKALLLMPVELLFNGGIGTYVKAVEQSHVEVGDRSNDAIRVNGVELKARIVGEGGNLGCTQLGRIEYALAGGKINTDFIDNAGGVICSDQEVNIKILMDRVLNEGELTLKQRNQQIEAMTGQVAESVLLRCREQILTLSLSEYNSALKLREYARLIHFLEKQANLDRHLESLPNDEGIEERLKAQKGLTRPELAVIMAYSKNLLKQQLLDVAGSNSPLHNFQLPQLFPNTQLQEYRDKMTTHPLRAEMVASFWANMLVNNMGLNFTQKMQDETGASIFEVLSCYSIAVQVFGFDDFKQQIVKLNRVIAAKTLHQVLLQLQWVIRRATRWFLRRSGQWQDLSATVERFQLVVMQLGQECDSLVAPHELSQLQAHSTELEKAGLSQELANKISRSSTVFSALDLAELAESESQDVMLIAQIYFQIGDRLDLHWFLEQINKQQVSDYWQVMARASFREELDELQRRLTQVVLRGRQELQQSSEIIEHWIKNNKFILERWMHMLAEFKTSKHHDLSKFIVALRELNLLIVRCDSVRELH